jgi:UDP-glucuronate 4-epimerase
MRVLVTGGAGFIGYHLASKLLADNVQVALIDNFNQFYDPDIKRRNVADLQRQGNAVLYEIDIMDLEASRRAFAEFRPDAIVHLAAWAGVRPSLEKPMVYTAVNVTGAVHMLELAREFGAQSFVFGSSSSVYGGSPNVPFSEDDPVAEPVSPYAATKRAGELLCYTYAHNYGLPITCLRFFTVYGPRQRPEMAIHKFAQLMSEGKEIPVFGDGSTRRDYTYIDDIVSGITAAIAAKSPFAIFNLGESQTVTLLELIRHLEKALGLKARLKFLPEQPGDMRITYADIRRARQALGYAPRVGIEEGIQRFASWFLQK